MAFRSEPRRDGSASPVPEGATSWRIARGVANLLFPPYVVLATVFFVAARSTSSVWAAIGWGMVAALFAAVLPYLVVVVGVRRGRWGNRELPRRQDRVVPLLIGLVSEVAGTGLLLAVQAPYRLVAAMVSLVLAEVIIIGITAMWKVSLHLAVVAGAAAVVAAELGGGAWYAGAPVLVLLGWARIWTRSHTLWQVVVGALVGGITVAFGYGLLVSWLS